ncbi:MAG: hypothetical protein NZ524_06915 [Thiobacillaceae bacterium]|nr:hypothetical protein [Thiobacillaceae bacterium]MCX7673893.1 hypothetical protein [Thiobacillaceae bacterium]MDW8323303.1 hypothetical protein [Burkholderiales bacterium]
MRLLLSLALVLTLVTGCATAAIQRKDGSRSERPWRPHDLAKSEVDLICELTQREVLAGLKLLTEKLYRRNPQEYRKAGLASVEAATERVFEHTRTGPDGPLARIDWRHGITLALSEGYAGDRVHLFMQSLTAMILAAYEYKTEFYFTDQLDAQKLYNSARNLEVAVWKLSNARLPDGRLVLLTNSMEGGVQNLSFEREFGKLIARQDLIALIVADRGNRTINRVVHGLVFLPL